MGWVPRLGSLLVLAPGEAVVIVVEGETDGVMLREGGLNDDLAARRATPGASGDLGQELECTLAGSEVG